MGPQTTGYGSERRAERGGDALSEATNDPDAADEPNEDEGAAGTPTGLEPGVAQPDLAPSLLGGPVRFGDNFDKKVRKHIDQVRNRGPVREAIPSPAKGGIERVQQIIRDRVAQGDGRGTTFAGEAAVAFEDGGVTYIFRPTGEFWTILGN